MKTFKNIQHSIEFYWWFLRFAEDQSKKDYLACLSIINFSYFHTFEASCFVEWSSLFATQGRLFCVVNYHVVPLLQPKSVCFVRHHEARVQGRAFFYKLIAMADYWIRDLTALLIASLWISLNRAPKKTVEWV